MQTMYNFKYSKNCKYKKDLLLKCDRYLSSITLGPSRGMGLTLGLVVAYKLFKRGDRVGYTQSTVLPQQLLSRTVA